MTARENKRTERVNHIRALAITGMLVGAVPLASAGDQGLGPRCDSMGRLQRQRVKQQPKSNAKQGPRCALPVRSQVRRGAEKLTCGWARRCGSSSRMRSNGITFP